MKINFIKLSKFAVYSFLSYGGRIIRFVFVLLLFNLTIHRTVIGVLSTFIVSLLCDLYWVRFAVVQQL